MKTNLEQIKRLKLKNRKLSTELARVSAALAVKSDDFTAMRGRCSVQDRDLKIANNSLRAFHGYFSEVKKNGRITTTCYAPDVVANYPDIMLLEQRVVVAQQLGYEVILRHDFKSGLHVDLVKKVTPPV